MRADNQLVDGNGVTEYALPEAGVRVLFYGGWISGHGSRPNMQPNNSHNRATCVPIWTAQFRQADTQLLRRSRQSALRVGFHDSP